MITAQDVAAGQVLNVAVTSADPTNGPPVTDTSEVTTALPPPGTNPPGPKPPLPQTGTSAQLWQLGIAAGLILAGGLALVAARRRPTP